MNYLRNLFSFSTEEFEGKTITHADTPLFQKKTAEELCCAMRNQCNCDPVSMGEYVSCQEYFLAQEDVCEEYDDLNKLHNYDRKIAIEKLREKFPNLKQKDEKFKNTADSVTPSSTDDHQLLEKIPLTISITQNVTQSNLKSQAENTRSKGKKLPLNIAVFTLLNSILGSGSLTIPYAVSCSGWALSLFIMLILSYITRYSVHLLLCASTLAGKNAAKTYESLGHHVMGIYGTYLAEFTFIFGGFGTLVSYFVFIADIFSHLLGSAFISRTFIMCTLTIGIIMPLSLVSHLGKLRFTSILAIFSIAYVCGLVGYILFFVTKKIEPSVTPIIVNSESVYTVTLLITAFACHNTVLPVFDELRYATIRRMNTAVSRSIGVSFLLYIVIGCSGYFIFGSRINDNILLNFTSSLYMEDSMIYYLFLLCKLLMGVALLLTCPIALWPFRSCALSVYLRWKNKHPTPSKYASSTEFIAMTLFIEVFVLTCAIYAPSVKIPLSIVGSVAGSLIIFIMPSLFFMLQRPYPVLSCQNIGPLLMLLAGINVAIIGFTMTTLKIWRLYVK